MSNTRPISGNGHIHILALLSAAFVALPLISSPKAYADCVRPDGSPCVFDHRNQGGKPSNWRPIKAAPRFDSKIGYLPGADHPVEPPYGGGLPEEERPPSEDKFWSLDQFPNRHPYN